MNWLQNILVGVMFFGALALVGYFTIISKSGPFARKGEQLVVYFDDSEGIKKGTRVTVLGVPVGNVADIELFYIDANRNPVPFDAPERVGQRVAITLSLRQPVVFFENYTISVRSSSLLSDPLISIDPGSMKPDALGRVAKQIPVLYSAADIESETGKTPFEWQLMKQKTESFVALEGESAKDPIGELSSLISENRPDLNRTLNNVADITEKINRGNGTLGMLVNDAELHKNASSLINDAEVVVREMREGLEDTREQAPVDSFLRAIFTAF